MQNNTTQPDLSLINTHYKDTNKNQIDIVYNSFYFLPQTMKEVEVNTSIDRANICRYIGKYRKQNKVAVLKKVVCSVTKHRAGLITTNPELFPSIQQLKLF